ncbi:GxxExxY protein [Candidatus Berkelbacteria bacterium CG10_big_fil_rev_8_21_14_0_10_43_13]|uniref:GxxExxY protein n=1 Tax=Candidatus Berkelbacteria bacterium CG10_big_fil_rev_8_21_14_0_10_43_13 TaxID=1974514 RepID=A0A2H0W6T1_9BACT|nr:MAG: GxxExxY protein [Candidatus Berkelbacteria bacterium CG10_big_fil_rev_8_21_14_0_10_43_13]
MTELLYKDLSYKITGLAYNIDNTIGYGQTEQTYGDALEELLKENGIKYQREVYFPILIGDKLIKREYFDFLIDDKIIVELKISDRNYKKACTQIFKYLKSSGTKLGLIIRFTNEGVRIKRIPNYY